MLGRKHAWKSVAGDSPADEDEPPCPGQSPVFSLPANVCMHAPGFDELSADAAQVLPMHPGEASTHELRVAEIFTRRNTPSSTLILDFFFCTAASGEGGWRGGAAKGHQRPIDLD